MTMKRLAPPALRDYQLEMKKRLYEAWKSHKSVMVQMPTGTGKTHLLAAVVREFDAIGGEREVWMVAHRRELVTQIEATVARYGMRQGEAAVRVMSIQWLARHGADMDGRPGLIVIDEAHHALADTYRELWIRYPEARILGLTATPCRMNRQGFTDLFDELITSWSIAEFIKRGRLAVFDYVSIRPDSLEQQWIDGLEKRGADGDYQVKEMNEVLNRRPGIARLYESVERFAQGKKGIVYAVGIAHARHIAEYYSQHGVRAVAIDSRTPVRERQRAVDDFRSGRIQVMVNVDVFSEGFDCPDVEFVQLARPTLSLAKYLQQVGRGLRKTEGKHSCVLIDNVGLYRVFGLPIASWDWRAMFVGETAGKARSVVRERNENVAMAGQIRVAIGTDEMEMVMSHDRLLAAIEEQGRIGEVSPQQAWVWKAYRDADSGRWGLMRGGRRITEAKFAAVWDVRCDMAAVQLEGTCSGLIDETGELVWKRKNCRCLKFVREDLMRIETTGGSGELYLDLRNLRVYAQRPEVKKYEGIELLKLEGTYYSRTKEVYASEAHIRASRICREAFYLTIFDDRLAAEGGYVCLLEGDEERWYAVHQWLADGSLIVTDADRRYYYAEAGREKRYIGCGKQAQGAAECREKMARLTEAVRQKQQKAAVETEKRRRRQLEEGPEAVPFCAGKKWGLRRGERVVVPPVYRRVSPPVGLYCAVEQDYGRWGVVSVDGKVRLEFQYCAVELKPDGTAVLTGPTGKKSVVKL